MLDEELEGYLRHHALPNQNQLKRALYFLAKDLEYVNLDGKYLFCEDNLLIQAVVQEYRETSFSLNVFL